MKRRMFLVNKARKTIHFLSEIRTGCVVASAACCQFTVWQDSNQEEHLVFKSILTIPQDQGYMFCRSCYRNTVSRWEQRQMNSKERFRLGLFLEASADRAMEAMIAKQEFRRVQRDKAQKEGVKGA